MKSLGLILVALCCSNDVLTKKVILMEPYEPSKVEGTWYVIRRNLKLFDSVSCIKYNLKHDPAIEDLYAMTTHWIDSDTNYLETHFNIVDDRSHKARYFFESQRDKLASSMLGTDYTGWAVGYGVTGEKETYYVASRTKTLTPEQEAAVQEVLKKNEVERDWMEVSHENCPPGH